MVREVSIFSVLSSEIWGDSRPRKIVSISRTVLRQGPAVSSFSLPEIRPPPPLRHGEALNFFTAKRKSRVVWSDFARAKWRSGKAGSFGGTSPGRSGEVEKPGRLVGLRQGEAESRVVWWDFRTAKRRTFPGRSGEVGAGNFRVAKRRSEPGRGLSHGEAANLGRPGPGAAPQAGGQKPLRAYKRKKNGRPAGAGQGAGKRRRNGELCDERATGSSPFSRR